MSKKIRSASDKIAIVMESFTTNIGAAELCRKHNLSPRVFYSWKEKFWRAESRRFLRARAKAQARFSKKKIPTSKH